VTNKIYIAFAQGGEKLNLLLVFPYVVGQELMAADLHIVPWLSHTLWGAGATGIQDFASLERLVGEAVLGFSFGERIEAWWLDISKRDSFKEIYAQLH
jgi:hypothetical protein